uniref:Uncharacterized protein n=1 Tax=Romanomermis culicivorax TaxID=13658 RepID=A0A915HKE2_ROMCU
MDGYNKAKENKCLYVVLVMSVYWVTEVLPLPVTALLPLVLYPVLGVMEADVDSLLLFMGGYFIAIAFEYSDLHRRLALKSLLMVGGDVKK